MTYYVLSPDALLENRSGEAVIRDRYTGLTLEVDHATLDLVNSFVQPRRIEEVGPLARFEGVIRLLIRLHYIVDTRRMNSRAAWLYDHLA